MVDEVESVMDLFTDTGPESQEDPGIQLTTGLIFGGMFFEEVPREARSLSATHRVGSAGRRGGSSVAVVRDSGVVRGSTHGHSQAAQGQNPRESPKGRQKIR